MSSKRIISFLAILLVSFAGIRTENEDLEAIESEIVTEKTALDNLIQDEEDIAKIFESYENAFIGSSEINVPTNSPFANDLDGDSENQLSVTSDHVIEAVQNIVQTANTTLNSTSDRTFPVVVVVTTNVFTNPSSGVNGEKLSINDNSPSEYDEVPKDLDLNISELPPVVQSTPSKGILSGIASMISNTINKLKNSRTNKTTDHHTVSSIITNLNEPLISNDTLDEIPTTMNSDETTTAKVNVIKYDGEILVNDLVKINANEFNGSQTVVPFLETNLSDEESVVQQIPNLVQQNHETEQFKMAINESDALREINENENKMKNFDAKDFTNINKTDVSNTITGIQSMEATSVDPIRNTNLDIETLVSEVVEHKNKVSLPESLDEITTNSPISVESVTVAGTTLLPNEVRKGLTNEEVKSFDVSEDDKSSDQEIESYKSDIEYMIKDLMNIKTEISLEHLRASSMEIDRSDQVLPSTTETIVSTPTESGILRMNLTKDVIITNKLPLLVATEKTNLLNSVNPTKGPYVTAGTTLIPDPIEIVEEIFSTTTANNPVIEEHSIIKKPGVRSSLPTVKSQLATHLPETTTLSSRLNEVDLVKQTEQPSVMIETLKTIVEVAEITTELNEGINNFRGFMENIPQVLQTDNQIAEIDGNSAINRGDALLNELVEPKALASSIMIPILVILSTGIAFAAIITLIIYLTKRLHKKMTVQVPV